jgi:hypothetical protein
MFEKFWLLLMELGKDVLAKAKRMKISQPAQAVIVLWELADLVVAAVEKLAAEVGPLTSEQKRGLAVTGFQKLVAELKWGDYVSDELLGWIVDKTVSLFNEKHGQSWLGKVWKTIKPGVKLLLTVVSYLPLVKPKKKG